MLKRLVAIAFIVTCIIELSGQELSHIPGTRIECRLPEGYHISRDWGKTVSGYAAGDGGFSEIVFLESKIAIEILERSLLLDDEYELIDRLELNGSLLLKLKSSKRFKAIYLKKQDEISIVSIVSTFTDSFQTDDFRRFFDSIRVNRKLNNAIGKDDLPFQIRNPKWLKSIGIQGGEYYLFGNGKEWLDTSSVLMRIGRPAVYYSRLTDSNRTELFDNMLKDNPLFLGIGYEVIEESVVEKEEKYIRISKIMMVNDYFGYYFIILFKDRNEVVEIAFFIHPDKTFNKEEALSIVESFVRVRPKW